MLIAGTVYSKRLERWRETYPAIINTDYVAGGQIHNLVHETIVCDWNLANPETRDETIENAISTIELVALPYFEQFNVTASLIEAMTHRDIPSMTIDRVIEFLICYADEYTARTAAVNFLQRRPELVRSYSRDYGRYSERGLDWCYPSGYAKQLAFASHLFGFGNLMPNGA